MNPPNHNRPQVYNLPYELPMCQADPWRSIRCRAAVLSVADPIVLYPCEAWL